MSTGHQLSSMEAARILHSRRKDHDIVVSAMGAARDWMTLAPHPRDWVFVPSSMGQATALGLGLALARPDLRVLVLGGDGGLIMNLGSLITISGQQPANLVLLIFDNGVYEVTGGQPTPASEHTREGAPPVDLPGIARASGFRSIFRYATSEAWIEGVDEALTARGPVFVHLSVLPTPGAVGPRSPGPAPARAKAFIEALAQGRKDAEPAQGREGATPQGEDVAP